MVWPAPAGLQHPPSLASACSPWSPGSPGRQSAPTYCQAGPQDPLLQALPVQGPLRSSFFPGGHQDTDGIPAVFPGPAKEVP